MARTIDGFINRRVYLCLGDIPNLLRAPIEKIFETAGSGRPVRRRHDFFGWHRNDAYLFVRFDGPAQELLDGRLYVRT